MSEHEHEHDEHDAFVDELRAAWRELQAPAATPERADAATEALVAELRAAWRALEPPAARVPWSLRLRVLRGSAAPLVRLAAALLLLVGAGLLVRALLAPERPHGEREEQARLEPSAPVAADVPDVPDVAPPTIDDHVRAVVPDATENGIVLTHGKVRLVMLEPVLETFEDQDD